MWSIRSHVMIAKLAMLAKLKENWERGYVNIFQQISTKKWVFHLSDHRINLNHNFRWNEVKILDMNLNRQWTIHIIKIDIWSTHKKIKQGLNKQNDIESLPESYLPIILSLLLNSFFSLLFLSRFHLHFYPLSLSITFQLSFPSFSECQFCDSIMSQNIGETRYCFISFCIVSNFNVLFVPETLFIFISWFKICYIKDIMHIIVIILYYKFQLIYFCSRYTFCNLNLH